MKQHPYEQLTDFCDSVLLPFTFFKMCTNWNII